MKIKRFGIYTLKQGEDKTSVVVVQNDHANKLSEYTIVSVYKDEKFNGIYTVNKEDLIEEIGILSKDKQEKLKDFYCSVITG